MKISISEAVGLINENIPTLNELEFVPLMKSFKRVNAKKLLATYSIPPSPISLRDGFAYLKNGSLIPIQTGQKVPKNSLCIIAKEDLREFDATKITTNCPFIKPKGEDIKKGSLLLKEYQTIGSFDITRSEERRVGKEC